MTATRRSSAHARRTRADARSRRDRQARHRALDSSIGKCVLRDAGPRRAKSADCRARHFLKALRKGWPRTLVVNRPHASDRRDRLLRNVLTRPGYDRDECPPRLSAVGAVPASCGVRTPRAGRQTSRTCPAPRTEPTDCRSGFSCVATATAPDSGTCSSSYYWRRPWGCIPPWRPTHAASGL
jgi:hypothetical protein